MDNCFPLSFLHDEATIKANALTHLYTYSDIQKSRKLLTERVGISVSVSTILSVRTWNNVL